jgi:hypothetical protein
MRISNYSRVLPIDFGTLFDIYTYSPFQKVQQKIYAFGCLSCPIARAFELWLSFRRGTFLRWVASDDVLVRDVTIFPEDYRCVVHGFLSKRTFKNFDRLSIEGNPVLGRLASTRCRISAIGQLMWVDEFIEGVRKQFGDCGNVNLWPIISKTVLHQRFGRDEVRQQIVGTRSLCSLLYGLFGLEMIQLALFPNTWNIWRLYDRVPFILSHEFEVVPAGWMSHCPFFNFGG